MALENRARIEATIDLIRQAREPGDDSTAEGKAARQQFKERHLANLAVQLAETSSGTNANSVA